MRPLKEPLGRTGGRENGGAENELYQIVEGTRKLCGFLATGCGTTGDDRLASLFRSVRIDDDEAWPKRPLKEWKQQINDICPRASGLLDQIASCRSAR